MALDSVGVDLGALALATLSDATVVPGPKALRRARRSARHHARVAALRRDHPHKPTTALAKTHGRLVVEDPNARAMLRNRHLARASADAGFGELRRRLAYKCAWHGGILAAASSAGETQDGRGAVGILGPAGQMAVKRQPGPPWSPPARPVVLQAAAGACRVLSMAQERLTGSAPVDAAAGGLYTAAQILISILAWFRMVGRRRQVVIRAGERSAPPFGIPPVPQSRLRSWAIARPSTVTPITATMPTSRSSGRV